MHTIDHQIWTEQDQDRQILLLLDNAPSHVTKDLSLVHVNVKFLPPNCTSKIQPMDAGIISAFKRRYRRLHYQHAVDQDERGAQNIYKVDQLTAMRWVHVAWNAVSAATIANCYRNTGLCVDGPRRDAPTIQEVAVDEEERAVERDLMDAIQTLRVRNPMSIETLLNPAQENQMCNVELSDEEIIGMVQQEEDSVEEEEPEKVVLTKAEKLQSISNVLSLLDLSDKSDWNTHQNLRRLQNSIRHTETIQTTLNSWLR